MRTRTFVISVVAAVVVAILLLTILNKKWWARRIMMKWDITSNLADNKELLFNTSLARMVQLYNKGMEGWQLRGSTGSVEQQAAVDGREMAAE